MKRGSPKIFIFGAGRVGGTLYHSLLKKGIDVARLTNGRAGDRRYSFERFIREINIFDVIILSVPDGEIEKVALKISKSVNKVNKKIILHTSGTVSFKALSILKKKGFIIGSLHPYFSFYQMRDDVTITDIKFTLFCEQKDLVQIKKTIEPAGIEPAYLEDRFKIPYHISAVFVSNFTALFVRIAYELLCGIGFNQAQSEEFILSLLNSTIYNLKRFGIDWMITGPAIRRDKRVLDMHRRYLKEFERDLYRLYSTATRIIQKIY